VLAGLGEQQRERGESRVTIAGLRLAQDDPRAAAAALAPVLDGAAPLTWPAGLIQALLLEAIARDLRCACWRPPPATWPRSLSPGHRAMSQADALPGPPAVAGHHELTVAGS
jgi:hypothetical protein